MTERPSTLSRFTGCLVGLAIGDALGAPYEFKRPPFDVAREFRTGHFGTKPGHPTDDSTLAAACADSLIEHGYFSPTDYGRRVYLFAKSNPPDIGGQTSHAAWCWGNGDRPPETRSAGNGALMAVAPIGLAYPYDAAAEMGWQFSEVTHPNNESRAACAVMAAVIAGLITRSPAEEWTLSRSWTPPYSSADARDAASTSVMGWAPLTLQLALECLDNTPEAEGAVDSLIDLIKLGGDTDTNACVAGALLGARFGLAAWPESLRSTLHDYDGWCRRARRLRLVARKLS